jgi:hypothetical protein
MPRVRPWATSSAPIPRGNAGTRKTLAVMSMLAQEGARDPVVVQAAHAAVRHVPERDDEATIAAVLTDVRMRQRYTRDPLDVELVKAPRAALEECAASGGKFVGDCDDASVLFAAMLGAVGVRTRFVVAPVDAARPGEWSHVYVSAMRSDGRWVAVDPIVRSFGVGGEAPDSALTGPRAFFPGASGGELMRNRLAPYVCDGPACPGGELAGIGDQAATDAAAGGSWLDSLFGGFANVLKQAPGAVDAYNRLRNPNAKPALSLPAAPPQEPGFFQQRNPLTGQLETDWTKVAVVGVGAAVVVGVIVVASRRRRRR